MKRILLAIDAVNPNVSTMEFACYLGRLTKSKLTGVFLEPAAQPQQAVACAQQSNGYMDWVLGPQSSGQQVNSGIIEKSIFNFQQGCIKREVNYMLHRGHGLPAQQMISESRYADIIVTGAETSFNKNYEGCPTTFVRDLLKKAECPVVIAPENFEDVDEIIFAYNGTSSAMFAMKQFTYLFPQLYNKNVHIVQVNETGQWPAHDRSELKIWLKQHYINFTFEAIQGEAGTGLFNYLLNRKNIFLVMGAYGRNFLSQFFYPSQADHLIQIVTQPIFIAHV